MNITELIETKRREMITKEQIADASADFAAEYGSGEQAVGSLMVGFNGGVKWAVEKMNDLLPEQVMRRENAEAEIEALKAEIEALSPSHEKLVSLIEKWNEIVETAKAIEKDSERLYAGIEKAIKELEPDLDDRDGAFLALETLKQLLSQ